MIKDRLTYRFQRYDPDGLSDRELLELLLRYSAEDPKGMSIRLMDQYPNIAVLMEATLTELRTVDGMDDETSILLRLIPELQRRYFLVRSHGENRLHTTTEYGNYMLPYFFSARDELVYMLMLDSGAKVINCRRIGEGSVNSANVPLRKLVQEALSVNASGVVLAHNHPSGIALPSKEDVDVTLRLRELLDMLGITLLDHIIVADCDFVSLRDSGYLHRF